MAVTLDQFVQQVAQSGILTAEELSSFRDSLPPDQKPDSAQRLAKALVKANWLTKYQVAAIYQGDAKSLRLGKYIIEDRLGKGGMGEVLKARHETMDRVVALKVLDPRLVNSEAAVSRFHREVKAAARLDHEHIVKAYDADQEGKTHFLVIQYVEGQDLSALVKENGRLPVDKAIDYTIQAARGLAFAHEQGVVHRDVKPGNFILGKDGVVRILDMGLARLEETGALAQWSLP